MSIPLWNAARVFSGNSPELPRWAVTPLCRKESVAGWPARAATAKKYEVKANIIEIRRPPRWFIAFLIINSVLRDTLPQKLFNVS